MGDENPENQNLRINTRSSECDPISSLAGRYSQLYMPHNFWFRRPRRWSPALRKQFRGISAMGTAEISFSPGPNVSVIETNTCAACRSCQKLPASEEMEPYSEDSVWRRRFSFPGFRVRKKSSMPNLLSLIFHQQDLLSTQNEGRSAPVILTQPQSKDEGECAVFFHPTPRNIIYIGSWYKNQNG